MIIFYRRSANSEGMSLRKFMALELGCIFISFIMDFDT